MRYRNHAISRLTSFKNEGLVGSVSVFDNIDSLRSFLKQGVPFYTLGKGSNVVINPDSSIRHFIKISPDYMAPCHDQTCLTASAGTSVNELMNWSKAYSLSGLSFMAGVPASLGGMIAMNFGCWGQEIGAVLEHVDAMDETGGVFRLTPEECEFGYRSSIFQRRSWIILSAGLSLVSSCSDSVKQEIHAAIKRRSAVQPLRRPTFGSIFKNPNGFFAAQMIDNLRLKGHQQGGAMISKQHANFMINRGGATYTDVVQLIQDIKSRVKEKHNIELQEEVQLLA